MSGGSRLGKGIAGYDIDGRGVISAREAATELYAGLREAGTTLLLACLPKVLPKWTAQLRGRPAPRAMVITQDRAAGPRIVSRTKPVAPAGGVLDDMLNASDEAVVRTQGGRPAPVTNPRSNAQTLTETQGATKPVRPIGGRLPSNWRYAGKTYYLKDPRLAAKYPKGVPFTESAGADFSQYAIKRVQVKGLTADYAIDEALANKAAGLARTPPGFTWHHVEDCVTMELVPSDLHGAVPHTGGGAILRSKGR
jgi:hypothetical protein